MDLYLVTLRDIKTELRFTGSTEELKASGLITRYCKKNRVIAILPPHDLSKGERSEYTNYLTSLTKAYLADHPDIATWSEFATQKDTQKVHKLLFEYGVPAEVFSDLDDDAVVIQKQRSATSLTLPEFYEVCQIRFHFDGSFHSFKRYIQRQYGSFAEYCILKGYDINNANWETVDTAIRVARKLGSIEAVKEKSKSLYKYLADNNLIKEVFDKKSVA